MKLAEALTYVDALDAVEAGTATSVQYEEAEAVIAGVREYLDGLQGRVSRYAKAVAILDEIAPEKAAAVRAALDGAERLPDPRISRRAKADEAVAEAK